MSPTSYQAAQPRDAGPAKRGADASSRQTVESGNSDCKERRRARTIAAPLGRGQATSARATGHGSQATGYRPRATGNGKLATGNRQRATVFGYLGLYGLSRHRRSVRIAYAVPYGLWYENIE